MRQETWICTAVAHNGDVAPASGPTSCVWRGVPISEAECRCRRWGSGEAGAVVQLLVPALARARARAVPGRGAHAAVAAGAAAGSVLFSRALAVSATRAAQGFARRCVADWPRVSPPAARTASAVFVVPGPAPRQWVLRQHSIGDVHTGAVEEVALPSPWAGPGSSCRRRR